MAGSLNKVSLIGNLGADPELRTMQNGRQMCTMRLATSERWRDKSSGEQRERTEWHRIVIFSEGLARIADQYLHKGSKVYIEGQLQTRKWQDQATQQDRYTTEIVLQGFNSSMIMLDGRSGGSTGGARGASSTGGGDTARQNNDGENFDDDIPF